MQIEAALLFKWVDRMVVMAKENIYMVNIYSERPSMDLKPGCCCPTLGVLVFIEHSIKGLKVSLSPLFTWTTDYGGEHWWGNSAATTTTAATTAAAAATATTATATAAAADRKEESVARRKNRFLITIQTIDSSHFLTVHCNQLDHLLAQPCCSCCWFCRCFCCCCCCPCSR